jgi:hypothetical protein
VDDAPLVGNKAPDFDAEAVFDQEFINVCVSSAHISLLRYRKFPGSWWLCMLRALIIAPVVGWLPPLLCDCR